ncbi:MAG: lysine--tRNA ligase, partial [Saprospiraceae bacterium]|nr:lysine--tRNA ligase [Saprospiraceae bacterium]
MSLSEQEIIRRQALQEIRGLGIDPFPAAGFEITSSSSKVKEGFSEGAAGFEGIQIAGRIMSRRIMGKASFVEIQDESGRIQLYISRDNICPDEDKTLYNKVFKKLLDIGDIIGIKGDAFITKTGETTIKVFELKLLSKSLRPLPIVKTDAEGQEHDAFSDPELRYRQRYVDLIVNPEVKEAFEKRTRMYNSMREYLNAKGYLEVET